MVSGQNVESFLITTFGDQPTRRFGNDQETETLDCREQALKETRNTPTPAVVQEEGSKRDRCTKNCSPIPRSLEEVGNIGSMFGMSNLSSERRGGSLRESESYSEHDASTEKSVDTRSCTLNDSGSQHDE